MRAAKLPESGPPLNQIGDVLESKKQIRHCVTAPA
jgi:hypothetical protein